MRFNPLALLTACAAGLMLAVGAAAQQQPAAPQQEQQPGQQQQQQERAGEEQVELAVPRHYPTEQITNMDVRNQQGENLGTINDLVIDVHENRVKYAALSFGGFLGLGDKLFAVPWEAFEFHYGEVEDDEPYFVLDVTREKLEQAEGFDRDKWPAVGDKEWMAGIDRHYGIERDGRKERRDDQATQRRDDQADDRGDDQGGVFQDDDPRAEERQAREGDVPGATVFRASELTGMEILNKESEDLGNLHDIVIDVTTGEVNYYALSFGGFLGLGDDLFAIPREAMQLYYHPEDEEHFFVLDVPRERLEQAEGFDRGDWPNTADPQWGEDVDRHYGVERERPRAAGREDAPRRN